MAINKIDAGLKDGPGVFAQPVLNQLQAMLNAYGYPKQFSDGYVKKGSLFSIGGSMFLADSDTAISGTTSKYVMLTVSGDLATASYATDLTGVSWNGAYSGYYDDDGNLYIFDELAAFEAGDITEFMREYAPIKYMRDGTTNGIDTKTVQGLDFATGSSGACGYQVIDYDGGTWVIPKGLYMMALGYDGLVLQEYNDDTWVGAAAASGLVLSDGLNFRITNNHITAHTVYYRKLL